MPIRWQGPLRAAAQIHELQSTNRLRIVRRARVTASHVVARNRVDNRVGTPWGTGLGHRCLRTLAARGQRGFETTPRHLPESRQASLAEDWEVGDAPGHADRHGRCHRHAPTPRGSALNPNNLRHYARELLPARTWLL